MTIFNYKLPIISPKIVPKPQDFWPRLKKIKFSEEWFKFESSLFPKAKGITNIFGYFKSAWGFKSCWTNDNQIFGVLNIAEMDIYYHFEIKEEKKKMKIFVGYLDKETAKGDVEKGLKLIDHVYESFFYILMENKDYSGFIY